MLSRMVSLPNLNWREVPSSNLAAFAYLSNSDGKTNELFIRFRSGSIYQYHKVPNFEMMFGFRMDAADRASWGKAYMKHIKGKYAATRWA
jgi:hypothetical protein